MDQHTATMDGNTAAAHVAYRVNEVMCDLSDHPVLYDGRIGG